MQFIVLRFNGKIRSQVFDNLNENNAEKSYIFFKHGWSISAGSTMVTEYEILKCFVKVFKKLEKNWPIAHEDKI